LEVTCEVEGGEGGDRKEKERPEKETEILETVSYLVEGRDCGVWSPLWRRRVMRRDGPWTRGKERGVRLGGVTRIARSVPNIEVGKGEAEERKGGEGSE